MPKRKTHEEYVEEVAKINPNIKVMDKYIDANTKILHKCKIDNYEWLAAPSKILIGRGCPRCGGNERYGHSEYVKRVFIKNPNIEVIEEYINAKTKILHRCKIDGYEWYAKPNSILSGRGCPRCCKKERKTNDDYIKNVTNINPFIEVVEKYINAKTPILHKCKIDGHEWVISPDNILRGCGCPVCAKNKKYTHEEYVNKVSEVNPDIEIIGKYVGSLIPILHKCKIDGHEWMVRPSVILYGSGCPKCNSSKGEKAIASWLDKRNVLYESQKRFDNCKNILSLPFDFYLPDYNICIEFQGKQHYEPVEYFGGIENFKKIVNRDKIKEKYCEENNILLYKISYFEDVNKELEKLYELIKTQNVEKGVVA